MITGGVGSRGDLGHESIYFRAFSLLPKVLREQQMILNAR